MRVWFRDKNDVPDTVPKMPFTDSVPGKLVSAYSCASRRTRWALSWAHSIAAHLFNRTGKARDRANVGLTWQRRQSFKPQHRTEG